MTRVYNKMSSEEKPTHDQDKLDLWCIEFSKVVQHDVSPMMDLWGLPLTDAARKATSHLPPYLPDDEITQGSGAERTAQLEEKYPGLLRVPGDIPQYNIPQEDDVIRQYPITVTDITNKDEL